MRHSWKVAAGHAGKGSSCVHVQAPVTHSVTKTHRLVHKAPCKHRMTLRCTAFLPLTPGLNAQLQVCGLPCRATMRGGRVQESNAFTSLAGWKTRPFAPRGSTPGSHGASSAHKCRMCAKQAFLCTSQRQGHSQQRPKPPGSAQQSNSPVLQAPAFPLLAIWGLASSKHGFRARTATGHRALLHSTQCNIIIHS